MLPPQRSHRWPDASLAEAFIAALPHLLARDAPRCSAQALDAGAGVEAGVEAEDATGTRGAHDGDVEGVPCREAVDGAEDGPSGAYLGHTEGQHVVGDGVETLESVVDGVRAVDPHVPVENLLVDLHARDEALAVPHHLIQEHDGAVFVEMGRAH